jgi:hypothetical protein
MSLPVLANEMVRVAGVYCTIGFIHGALYDGRPRRFVVGRTNEDRTKYLEEHEPSVKGERFFVFLEERVGIATTRYTAVFECNKNEVEKITADFNEGKWVFDSI